jgi:hypothetical protein
MLGIADIPEAYKILILKGVTAHRPPDLRGSALREYNKKVDEALQLFVNCLNRNDDLNVFNKRARFNDALYEAIWLTASNFKGYWGAISIIHPHKL